MVAAVVDDLPERGGERVLRLSEIYVVCDPDVDRDARPPLRFRADVGFAIDHAVIALV